MTCEPRATDITPPMRALIVGSDAAARRRSRRVLSEFGFVASEAENGVTATTMVRDEVPDLVVMDVQLPDVSGGQAAAWIRTIPGMERTPIIMVGGEPNRVVTVGETPLFVLLSASFSTTELRHAVQSVRQAGDVLR